MVSKKNEFFHTFVYTGYTLTTWPLKTNVPCYVKASSNTQKQIAWIVGIVLKHVVATSASFDPSSRFDQDK
jgi:hypothetical protein